MKKADRTPAPGFDVSDYGAMQRIRRFITENLLTNRLATLGWEKEGLKKKGYDPNILIPVDRIGYTGIFVRISFSEPILVNEDGEVRDLNLLHK